METETEEAKPKQGTQNHFLAKSKQGKHFLLETETKEAKPKQGTNKYGARVAKIVGSWDPSSKEMEGEKGNGERVRGFKRE